MADIPPYPLYNQTYLLYRLSPLHHADQPLLREPSLRTHARRLKEQLKGDNVRGVQVDFDATESAIPRLGPLEECEWDLIGDEDAWIDRHRQLLDPDASHMSAIVTEDQARGVEVSLEYDRQSYNALLLRDPGVTTSPEGFTSLPLLLVKMPAAIRDIFLNYLRTSFDAHVAPLSLTSAFLTKTLSTYFRHLSADNSTQSIQTAIRQLEMQLSFPKSTSLLKHIQVTVMARDVPGFVARGMAIKDKHKEEPFSAALRTYLLKHIALDLSHKSVQISRISCACFVLASDRMKLMAPDISSGPDESSQLEPSPTELAASEFCKNLVREATGTGQFLPEDTLVETRSSTPSSTTSNRRTRKRAVSAATVLKNPKSKRTKASGKENGDREDDGETEDA